MSACACPPKLRRQSDKASLYQEITDQIIAELEAGRTPWAQPWAAAKAGIDLPHNASTRRRYSGVNILILWRTVIERGFSTQAFLTFRQALALGGAVRKGERGTMIVYADRFTPEEERRRADAEGREAGAIAFLKRFTVFNTDQCDGLPDDVARPPPPIPAGMIAEDAAALIAATRAEVRIGGDQAFYDPRLDYVQVPRPDAFFEPINWHRTAFHELAHWSGHRMRLDRDQTGLFGSAAYGKEELVAEIGVAFVCASLGVEPTVRHADYLGAWLEILREDNRAIVRAASAASKAADFLLAFRKGGSVPEIEGGPEAS